MVVGATISGNHSSTNAIISEASKSGSDERVNFAARISACTQTTYERRPPRVRGHHASAAMTLDTYADLFDNDLDAVADRLDVVVRRSRTSCGLAAD